MMSECRVLMRDARHEIAGAWVRQMLHGHLNYYAVPGNDPSLRWFVAEVRWRWLKILKRRSQHAGRGAIFRPYRDHSDAGTSDVKNDFLGAESSFAAKRRLPLFDQTPATNALELGLTGLRGR